MSIIVDCIEDQKEFNNKTLLYHTGKTAEELDPKERKDWLVYGAISLEDEASEVRRELPWKKHMVDFNYNRANLLEELVDCQKFLWNLLHIAGVDVEEFIDAYWEKSAKVEDKWNNFIEQNKS